MMLFARLKGDNQSTWHAYINHKFVTELAGGTLKNSSFKPYLS